MMDIQYKHLLKIKSNEKLCFLINSEIYNIENCGWIQVIDYIIEEVQNDRFSLCLKEDLMKNLYVYYKNNARKNKDDIIIDWEDSKEKLIQELENLKLLKEII